MAFSSVTKGMRFIMFFSHTHIQYTSQATHCKTGAQELEPVPPGLQQEKRVKQAWQRKKQLRLMKNSSLQAETTSPHL